MLYTLHAQEPKSRKAFTVQSKSSEGAFAVFKALADDGYGMLVFFGLSNFTDKFSEQLEREKLP